ncbi:type IV pilin biogenesis protein [Geobacillus sp. BCO2]|nr:type IV pilin biogenesis protein [Geobacillus sp. BCO2]
MKRKMWPLAEQALFFTRLGRLLERGYPLGQALEFLAIQAPTHRRLEIERCLQQLRAGLPLFAAVEALSVDRMAVNLLFFCRTDGDLPRGMAETGEALAQKARFHEQLRRFSRYPLFLLSLLIIMLVLMEWWLLPQFERAAAAFSPQHGHTAWLLAVIAHAPMAMAAIAVLAVFSGLFYAACFRRWPVSRKLQFALRIPGLASFLRLFVTCLTARQLGRCCRPDCRFMMRSACSASRRRGRFCKWKVGAFVRGSCEARRSTISLGRPVIMNPSWRMSSATASRMANLAKNLNITASFCCR